MCKAEFTCAPPTRDELMQSFTGPEIAALIDAKCIIVATSDFSQNMVSGMKQNTKKAFQDGWSDWTESVLLIIEVCDIWEGEHLAFCDEHVQAVNLTQPIEWSKLPDYVEKVVSHVLPTPGLEGASCVQLSHYIGGPVYIRELTYCIVFGGDGCGWTVKRDLKKAIELARTFAARPGVAQGAVCGGQTVRIQGLQDAPKLNGELGIVLSFNEENGLWLVMLQNGEEKQLKPTSLESLEGEGGRVLCFWGYALWSRKELLDGLTKDMWRLCMGNVGILVSPPIESHWGTPTENAIAEMCKAKYRFRDHLMTARQFGVVAKR
jgi:hypothetical protein